MVKVNNNPAEFPLKEKFEKLLNGCKTQSQHQCLHQFFGDVNEMSIEQISREIEIITSSNNYSKSRRKKVFTIVIEGLQNIFRHGLSNLSKESIGAFLFCDSGNNLHLHFINLIQAEDVLKMKTFCANLKLKSLKETKELYLKTLLTSDLTEKGGASLGCMLMKLKSDGNLEYIFDIVGNDLSCFHLSVVISK
jgi:hypothetical protein